MRVLITGGAGFIGGHLIKRLLKNKKKIFCIDKLGYASNYNNIKNLPIVFEKIDLTNYKKLYNFFKKYKPKLIFHLAAESHVDNSIQDSIPFVRSNIFGTVNLLNICKIFKIKKFIHVSTDEVYGSINKNKFNEMNKKEMLKKEVQEIIDRGENPNFYIPRKIKLEEFEKQNK